jgi:hypothetical protein
MSVEEDMMRKPPPEYTEQRFRAFGSVHEYYDLFKTILKRYLTMKYQ